MKGDRPNHVAIVLDGNRRWAKRILVMRAEARNQESLNSIIEDVNSRIGHILDLSELC